MFRILPLILAVLATPALSQSTPSFDCTLAESSVELMICEDAELAALDRIVAERYAAALNVIGKMDTGRQAAKDQLRAIQRGWIKGRNECWKASDVRSCVEFAYLSREAQLVTLWMLEQPTSVAFWACDGNPANEVVTSFFDTTLPSVRFERGDTVDTGALVPTGSGAKYEGNFGRSIWIKGDEASYREPDPDGSTLSCTLVKEN